MSAFSTRTLGRTGLVVSPLGIGGGGGISNEDLFYAFENGINYFFYSSDFHNHRYCKSLAALKKLCHESSTRQKIVLSTVSYVNDPEKLAGVVFDQFEQLGVDYVDVFHWGWITDDRNIAQLLSCARSLTRPGLFDAHVRSLGQQVLEVNENLLRMGLARFVGASFHSRSAALLALNSLDVVMLRYNVAHLGIESDIFPALSGDKSRDPGIVVFNSAHDAVGKLNWPPSYVWQPTIPDLYRFALTQPQVDVVLTGLSNRQEINEAIAGINKGPLSNLECKYLREYHHAWTSFR